MTAPMFATVSFANGVSGTEHQAFRVPIDNTTTVKALARSAVSRLAQQHKVSSSVGVREIHVGPQQVKLFVHDVVVHVVNVAEERIVIVLTDRNSPAVAPPVAAPIHQNDDTRRSISDTDHRQSCRSDTQPAPMLVESRSVTQPSKSPSPMLTAEQQLDIMSRILQRRSKSPAMSRYPSEVANVNTSSSSQHNKRSGHMPAPVVVASPRPIERPDSRTSPKKRQRTGEDVLTPEVAKVTRVEELSANDRSQFIQQKSQEGWGPEAYRNFESNYTSDPDKLARELRKQRALQAKASKAAAIDCDASTAPSQQQTTTVPRKVTARSPPISIDERNISKNLFTEGEANSPIMIQAGGVEELPMDDASRPTGWGVKASKFFDASTYHDDPSKAKLDPALLNEPVRARRSTRGPLFN